MKTVILRTNTVDGDVRATISDNVYELRFRRIVPALARPYDISLCVMDFVFRDSGRRTAEGLEMWVSQPCAAV